MGNIVVLGKRLTFGKHKGLTAAELLKSKEGTRYLVWLYNNTDIQMDCHVVTSLSTAGLVDRKQVRNNSKDRSANPQPKIELKDGGNLSQVLGRAGVNSFNELEGRTVFIQLAGRQDIKSKLAGLREMLNNTPSCQVEENFRRHIARELRNERNLFNHK